MTNPSAVLVELRQVISPEEDSERYRFGMRLAGGVLWWTLLVLLGNLVLSRVVQRLFAQTMESLGRTPMSYGKAFLICFPVTIVLVVVQQITGWSRRSY